MKYYIIAGEASGDLHGANLMKGLLKSDADAHFRFWGGDSMAEVGGAENLAKHYKATSFFGITEVIKNIRTVLSQLDECKRDVEAFAPDVLICIDYPGFNLKVAKFAKEHGIKVFYYISPKVWAWKEGRVAKLKRYVDKLFIIFPFEIEYFRQRGIEAIYEGNPLMDSVEERRAGLPPREEFIKENNLEDKPIIALLAGSRASEIKNNLPFMAELSTRFPAYQFVLAGVPWLERRLYDEILSGSGVKFVCNKTYETLSFAEAAVVTSGTATLEAALIGTPEVVCYKTDGLSARVGKLLIKVKFISLVNLIMDREVVRELIQWDMTMPNAEAELGAILPGGNKRETMLADFAALRRTVGEAGASERFAARMVALITNYKLGITNENNLHRAQLCRPH
jgi:lipid-A-disaccharide synthase